VWETDDGTLPKDSALYQWGPIFTEWGAKSGRSFTVVDDELQRKAMESAGFVDIDEFNTKVGLVCSSTRLPLFLSLPTETDCNIATYRKLAFPGGPTRARGVCPDLAGARRRGNCFVHCGCDGLVEGGSFGFSGQVPAGGALR